MADTIRLARSMGRLVRNQIRCLALPMLLAKSVMSATDAAIDIHESASDA